MEWKPIEWTAVEGRLRMVSINLGGLWGLSENGDIYHRCDTFENYQSPGHTWWQVEGNLQQLSVGWNVLWGVDRLGQVWFRDGIDIDHPIGLRWVYVSTPGPFKQVTVDRLGHVWALSWKNEVFMRVGACVERIPGNSWKKVGDRRMSYLDVGKCGVWAVDENKEVYYREGTYGESGSEGTDWTPVNPGCVLLVQVSSGGDDMLVGVTSKQELYARAGMSLGSPTGKAWKRLPGELNQIDVYGYMAWGCNFRSQPVWTVCWPRSEAPGRLIKDTFY